MATKRIIRNLDDFKVAANKVYRGNKSASSVVNDLVFGDGTGSLILDKIIKSSNKRTGTLANKIKNSQRKFVEFDMKAGAKMHDTIGKGLDKKEKLNFVDKARKKVSESFIKEYDMEVSKPNGINPGKVMKVEAGGLFEPVVKAKNKVVPFVGATTIAGTLASNKENQKGGEDKVASEKEMLIEKIAGCKPSSIKESDVQPADKDVLLKKAGEMLKIASAQINKLETFCEKLAIENQSLHLDLVQREKRDEACKIANEMHVKGLIKKADIEEKISDISNMDNESLSLFKKAMEDVVVPHSEGITDLTFVLDKDNIKSKDTLIDAFSK